MVYAVFANDSGTCSPASQPDLINRLNGGSPSQDVYVLGRSGFLGVFVADFHRWESGNANYPIIP